MAKFGIYSAAGVKKAEGYPTFTGTYMKAGVLDFREIASPIPINWAIGDYVGYEFNGSVVPAYSRTGFKYVLYKIPQVRRQASNGTYGGAFVYQNVQFFDDSHQADICPFRDLVPGDNRVHFSTQPQISVFDNVAGIAERLQACLEDMYGSGSWVVRTATAQDGASQELLDLMADEREFVVSGVSITGALEKVYEIWPEVGFVYTIESGVNTLIIGGAGLNANEDTYKYGKGYGLTSIAKTVANADDMANRLYVYGSARNMLSRWYSQFDIKDADSVDIQHLMLPISVWGTTDDKPDPAKAFIETPSATSNLRPKTVYFDGTQDLKEIYPTIRETTIQALWDAMPQGSDFRPDTSVWTGTERIDTLLSAQASFDSGLAADNGKSAVQNLSWDAVVSSSASHIVRPNFSVPLFARDFALSEAGSLNFEIVLNANGTVSFPGTEKVMLRARIHRGYSDSTPTFIDQSVELEKDASGNFIIAPASFSASRVQFASTGGVLVSFSLEFSVSSSQSSDTLAIDMDGSLTAAVSRYRAKTFNVTLRQIGFDISAQANIGDGKTMVMRSGKCVGRAFKISSTSYNSTTDTWDVELIRSNDESLSQWFPNNDYPVEADDEFVLTEIAMPDIYISLAENRLLAAAQELLADTSKEQWQYTPDIDAKFMIESGRTILPATNVTLEDEIVPGGSVSMLVDSVTINEGDAAIPTYKLTLRDKKRKSYSDTASVQEPSSTPVSTVQQTVTPAQRTVINDSFFEEDGNGNIKLKDVYGGFWAQGFITAGGVGSGGGGGGGLIEQVYRIGDFGGSFSANANDTFNAYAINSLHERITQLEQNPGGVTSVAGLTGAISAPALYDALGLDSEMGIISKSLQSLQSQIDSVSARDMFDELKASSLFSDNISTSSLYADSIILSGVDLATNLANFALKTTSITGAGYLTGGGDLSANRTLDIAETYKTYIQHGESAYNRTNWDDIFAIDGNGNVYIKQYTEEGVTKSRGFYTYGFVTAGGAGSGSVTPTTLDAVWNTLRYNTGDYKDVELNPAHIPSISYTKVTGLGTAATYGIGSVASGDNGLVTGDAVWRAIGSVPTGTVTSVGLSLPTGLTVNGSPITSSGTFAVSYASGYSIPLTADTAKGVTAYDSLGTISDCLQSLQSQIDSVASRDLFDELKATSLFADTISASGIYAGAITLDGSDLATRISSIENNFDANGNAKSALKLTTVSKTIWGQTYWTSGGVPQDVTTAPNLYIGGSKVQTSQAAQALVGISSISAVVSPGSDDDTKIEWDANANAWHFHGGIYADTFITAGGVGSGGSVPTTLDAVWNTLRYNTGDYQDVQIDVAHIPGLPWSKIISGKPSTLAGYGITDAGFSSAGVDDKIRITLGSNYHDVLTAHQSLSGYATEAWVGQQGFITSSVNNLVNYYKKTETYSQQEVRDLIAAINQFHYEVYPSTSSVTDPQSNVLYLIGPTGSGSDKYEEYVYPNATTGWTKIGDTTIDLSAYLTITSAQATYQPIISDLSTIRTQAGHGETAYNSLDTISDCLQSLQSQIDSVATRNDFDELNASSVFSDIVAATSIYVGSIALGGNDLATTLSNLSGRIGTVEGKFTGDSANSALRLAGTSAYSIWGVEYWSSGVPKSVTGRPGLFIGSTQVQTSSSTQDLAGIGSITAAGALTLSSTKKIYFGDSTHYIELDADGYFHFSHGLYSEGFVTAGGVGTGGGGGVDLDRVWASLTNSIADSHANDKIALVHIPDMAGTYGYLKENQTITLTGVVTGSGTTSITTSIANNALSIAMVNGLQAALDSKTSNVGTVTSVDLSMPTGFSVANSPITSSGTLAVSFASGYSLLTSSQISTWDGKQDAISDLATIRSNASNGNTAYGWGNHANAGYFAASSFTASNIVSTLGNTAVNRAKADTAGENIANNFTTVGNALKSLQSQIDSVASRSVYDELTATNLYSDMAVGVSAYFSNFYGNLTGTASNATNADNADKLDGVHASGLFTELTTSAGSTNLYITIGGTRLSKTIYAYYDSDGGIIASNMTTIGTALRSLQSQIDSVATNRSFDEISITSAFVDMLSVGSNVNVGGTIHSIGGIDSNSYITAGAAGASSDARLKTDIKEISAERAIQLLSALKGKEWTWNEKKDYLAGKHGSGLIAQEVLPVMPWAVLDLNGEYSLNYNTLWGVAIPVMQSHEQRIEALERENKELKHKIEILTNNS